MEIKSFEEGLKKLEEITSLLEDSNMPLKKRIEKFEEGKELLKVCEKELKDAEMSIRKIIDEDDKIEFQGLQM